MLLQFFALFLLSIHGALTAPTCEPSSFCYTPNKSTKVVLTRTGSNLNLKIIEEHSTIKQVRLVQNEGKEVVVNCASESLTDGKTCGAHLTMEQFKKNLPVSIKLSDSQISDPFSLESLAPPAEEGLTKQQRRQFSKAHAILMIFGWLLFVPTGFLFARLGKDLYSGEDLFGNKVWFQIHRASNFMGVVCICASMLCIFISQQWNWRGTGSGSKYWTEVHTDLGVISSVLAVSQPINSLFRCGPTHSKRVIFNWAHRCVGIVAYTLALTAIIIAAVHFQKIWNEPLMELVLVSLPILICFAASIVFYFLENEQFRSKAFYGPHTLKTPVIFWAIGVFFCVAVALSLLVVNGYKNA